MEIKTIEDLIFFFRQNTKTKDDPIIFLDVLKVIMMNEKNVINCCGIEEYEIRLKNTIESICKRWDFKCDDFELQTACFQDYLVKGFDKLFKN